MENKTLFPIEDIVKLRQSAQEADDPMVLLAIFPSLHIKKGFILHAYPYRTQLGGVGNVWAVPESSIIQDIEKYETIDLFELARPFPIDNSCLDGLTMNGPVKLPHPPDALDNIMEAIEGDRTPWSYLLASIFAREIADFGASWHGVIWSTHTILSGDPWTYPHVWFEEDEKGLLSEQGWQCSGRRPSEWKPSVVCDDGVTVVKFYTYSMLVQEAIYCFTDIYEPNSYKFKGDVEIIAEGPNSMLF